MIKKILSIGGIIFLTIFSFYYTDKMVDLVKEKDPIMIEILKQKDYYNEEPVNASIDDNYIIPGIIGTEVDIEKSYYKMKKLGEYNENLYMFINDYPKISIKDNLNKFIINGNKGKKHVFLIFKVKQEDYMMDIINILANNKVIGNFFIDGYVLENNLNLLKTIYKNNNFLGNLGYNNEYNRLTIKYTNSLIEKFVNYEHNFCYVETDDFEVLNMCSKLNMYTIKSVLINGISSYSDIKSRLQNGGIYTIDLNEYTIKGLDTIIKYIKYKGYDIVSLNELISENS